MASHRLLTAFRSVNPIPAFGLWVTLPGTLHLRHVLTSALSSSASPHLSWLMLDCEHGHIALNPGCAEAIQAVASLGGRNDGDGNLPPPSILVRVPAIGSDPSVGWQIKYALDAGARGVLVPMVSTASQASAIVSASRFPPQGTRGLGNPFTPTTWSSSLTLGDYLRIANDSVLVLVQIETREGYENLESILAVDGFDGVFIGPFDLSLAYGLPPPSPDPHPEIEQMIQRILTKAREYGKKCAIYCTSGTQAYTRSAQGFDMINIISDSGAMAEGIARHLEAAATGSTNSTSEEGTVRY